MTAVAEFVLGVPAPQGSKVSVQPKGAKRPRLIEQSKKVKPWRKEIARQLSGCVAAPIAVPVEVGIVFVMPRPESHYGTGRNATRLRITAPPYPTHQRDVDKLCRSTLDGIVEAGVLADDSLVVKLRAEKRYGVYHEPSGAFIEVRRIGG